MICYYRKRRQCDVEGGKVPNLQLLAQDIQWEEIQVGEARNKHCVRTEKCKLG